MKVLKLRFINDVSITCLMSLNHLLIIQSVLNNSKSKKIKLKGWTSLCYNDIMQVVADDLVRKEDIWDEIPEGKSPRKIKKMVEKISNISKVREAKYYRLNPRFYMVNYSFLFPCYLKMSSTKFARCKIENGWDEVVVSKGILLFLKYGYRGREIYLDYSEDSFDEEDIDPEVIEKLKQKGILNKDEDYNSKPKRGYKRVYLPKDIDMGVKKVLKETKSELYLATYPEILGFGDIKAYLKRYKPDWNRAENEYLGIEEKDVIFLQYNPRGLETKIKIKSKYFELSDIILNWIFNGV